MIPQKYAHVAFALVLSGLMSFLVSGISTLRALGLSDGFIWLWMTAWLPSWGFAFPAVLVVAPIARRIVNRMVRAEG